MRAVLGSTADLDRHPDSLAGWSASQQAALRQYTEGLTAANWPTLTPSAERIIRYHLRTDRPGPRYVGQHITLRAPAAAVPALTALYAEANLSQISVVPHPEGMWVMFHWRDPDLRVHPGDTAIWWQPTIEQGDRAPMDLPFDLWTHFHLLLCCFWSDLHRNAEVILPDQDAPEAAPPPPPAEPAAPPPGKARPARPPRLASRSTNGADHGVLGRPARRPASRARN